ncbi:MAG: hypothetical protein NXI10_03730 [bacterium]|nr:hypothetical protein [bacterium]
MRKLLLGALLLCAVPSYAQLSLNLDHTKSKQIDARTIGLNMQYLFRFNSYSLPGINTGMYFRSDAGAQSVMVPANLQYRYYLIGAQSCCGGIYTEVVGGANFIKSLEDRTSKFEAAPTLTGGLGIYIPIGIDVNFRFGGEYRNEKISPFYGVKLGYVI